MEHSNKHHRSEQLAAHFLTPNVHMWLASRRLCLPSSCLLKRKWVYVCVGFLLVTSLHAQPLKIVITNSFLFVRHRWGSAKARESVGWWEMSAGYGYLIKLVGADTFLKGNGTAEWAGTICEYFGQLNQIFFSFSSSCCFSNITFSELRHTGLSAWRMRPILEAI